MAIKTKYSIKFTCGHSQVTDLGTVPAGKRESRAKWYAKNRVCGKCFKAQGVAELAKDNAQILAEAEVFEQENDLPELTGSEKQVPWATQIRYRMLSDGLENIGEQSPEAGNLWAAAKTIIRSGWWIDYKDVDPDEVYEVVTTGAVAAKESAETRVETENPF